MNKNDINLRVLYLLKDRSKIITDSILTIIGYIKSDDLLNQVDEIRRCNSSEYKKKLKLQLPAFFPNLLFLENDTNGTIRPSGIINFDIDLKDNAEELDIVHLKKIIINIPSCIYAYISPSGGLKFGIKTDFTDFDGDESAKERFKCAYNLMLKYVIDMVPIEFICDKKSSSIEQTSFFSYDPDAYINLNCEEHHINEDCIYVNNYEWIPLEPKQDREQIIELLKYIPKLDYIERLTINYAVLNCLGAEGESILINHWENRGIPSSDIRSDIKSQSKHIRFGSIGHLINVARKNGYTNTTTGRARKILKPYKSDVQLKPLLSPAEGIAKLHEIVQEFFSQNNNIFVNVSTGAGKSSAVLKVLAEDIPYNKKILFLVPSHSLASELEEKFKVARNRPELNELEKKNGIGVSIQDKEFNSMLIRLKTFKKPISGVVHLYGKGKLCESEFAKKAFDGANNIPTNFCMSCHYPTGCRYIEQFQNRFDNIRIMTHFEWKNSQSAWFHGYDEKLGSYKKIQGDFVKIKDDYIKIIYRETGRGKFLKINGKDIPIINEKVELNNEYIDVNEEYIEIDGEYINVSNENIEEDGDLYPSGNKWVPDYIIVDENIISAALENIISDDGNKHKSVSNIINSVNMGKSLSKAVEDNFEEIINDDFTNTNPKYPPFNQDIAMYTKLITAHKEELKSYSVILERLIDYLKTKQHKYLQGMWVADNKLNFAPVTQASMHYQHIPTLFLDATANAEVINATLGNIKFHSISIQSKSDIQLFQLANTTITKEYINDANKRTELVSWIKSIIDKGQYKRIGLITYIKANDIEGDFDKFLASKIGADVYSHFGAIRGMDSFDNVDCLLIVGRHFIGTKPVSELSAAIFGEFNVYETTYADMPIRMKDGSKYFVNSHTQVNGKHMAVNEHFSLAETKQAIGRSRAIHGKKKDVYLFSNESLGLDIEVTDFFYLPAKDTVTCSDEVIKKIKEVGYVLNKSEALKNIGINENDIKSRRTALVDKFAENGIYLTKCIMVETSYRKSTVEYFISDKSKFIVGEKYDNKKFKSFVEKEDEIS